MITAPTSAPAPAPTPTWAPMTIWIPATTTAAAATTATMTVTVTTATVTVTVTVMTMTTVRGSRAWTTSVTTSGTSVMPSVATGWTGRRGRRGGRTSLFGLGWTYGYFGVLEVYGVQCYEFLGVFFFLECNETEFTTWSVLELLEFDVC